MRDLDYLSLLSSQFKNIEETSIEIANLSAILTLPKGTEYFFSDLHGEHESFIHLLRSAAGVIRQKLRMLFSSELSEEEILLLANFIYYPDEKLANIEHNVEDSSKYYYDMILKLMILLKSITTKYSKSKVRKTAKPQYVYLLDELLHKNFDEDNSKKVKFYEEIINSIIKVGLAKNFIKELCRLIQKLSVDTLHIVGDIFDRGARHDLILDELISWRDVDIEWGNHDVEWMGAFFGNEVLIVNALRIAIKYNCFDMLEDGYGINLRKLSEFAYKTYADDNCDLFMPSILDENEYDVVDPELTAKMHKALAIIQFKLEGQLIKKHPEYNMDDRIMLTKINYDTGMVHIEGKDYKMNDMNFPTIDKNDPLKLTKEEEDIVKSLKASFTHSVKLQEHIKFVFQHGNLYKVSNGNLLYHGIIPFDEHGDFLKIDKFDGSGQISGKEYLDYLNDKIKSAYNDVANNIRNSDNIDFMYYMWCGKYSPVFGRDKMRTFELYFVDDKDIKKEKEDLYYNFAYQEKYAIKILVEFGLNIDGHIINGHVPVKQKDGESPVKANGRLYIIDGGLSKGYQKKTGIAGYTLIFDSIHLTLATHKPFEKGKFNTPVTNEVEKVAKTDRLYVRDTDNGKLIAQKIKDLEDLLLAYKKGLIKQA